MRESEERGNAFEDGSGVVHPLGYVALCSLSQRMRTHSWKSHGTGLKISLVRRGGRADSRKRARATVRFRITLSQGGVEAVFFLAGVSERCEFVTEAVIPREETARSPALEGEGGTGSGWVKENLSNLCVGGVDDFELIWE